jgi:hypothetical protein
MPDDDSKTLIKVTIGDKEVEIEAGSRLLNQIRNLEEESLQSQFSEARDQFIAACQKNIDDEMDGMDADALEGMALVYYFDGGPPDKEGNATEPVHLVQGPRVIIKQRMPRVVATANN